MKKFVKILATVIVFGFIGLFIFRCCMSADKSVFSEPVMTDAISALDGEYTLYTHTQTTELSTDGYFKAYKMYYCPEAREVQLAVRWNDSAYSYTDMPEGYEFTFRVKNDTTGEEYPCEVIESDKKAIYNYRRIVAEGVSLASDEQLSVIMEVNDTYESTQIVKCAEQAFREKK